MLDRHFGFFKAGSTQYASFKVADEADDNIKKNRRQTNLKTYLTRIYLSALSSDRTLE